MKIVNPDSSPIRVAAVSFLNARPLVSGLDGESSLALSFDVPSRLAEQLRSGAVDVALVPIMDVLRADGGLTIVSDACIGSDGETMTVRVFSQQRPDRISRLAVDGDSHTSVALARVLWREMFERDLDVHVIDARRDPLDALDAVLLIGDKVVDPRRAGFAFEVDLGGAWKSLTGLPFVFAAWACPTSLLADPARQADLRRVATALGAARDRGVADALAIAGAEGPRLGWSIESAQRYLARCLKFTLDDRMIAGAERFAAACRSLQLCSPQAVLPRRSFDEPDGRSTAAHETLVLVRDT